jgi:hypothetical protein
MNSSTIFEIAMNCPPGLSHPRLTESNAWIDALLEQRCREEEERLCGREPELVSVLGKRKRSESDISDYEEEIDNAVTRSTTPCAFDFGFKEMKVFELNKAVSPMILYFEAKYHWDIIDKMEAGLLTKENRYNCM